MIGMGAAVKKYELVFYRGMPTTANHANLHIKLIYDGNQNCGIVGSMRWTNAPRFNLPLPFTGFNMDSGWAV